ncbi:MAG: KH domain-containing protein [Clostridia bacterium]|nr:KH domain-containing protein [Clostridia bacterium]
MKKEIEISAKTKEEAIALAVEQLGAPSESALVITVVREARKGFLGFGAVDATIHAVYQIPDAPVVTEGEDGESRPRRPRGDHRQGGSRDGRNGGKGKPGEKKPAKPEGEPEKKPAPKRPANIDPATASESEQNAYRFICKLVENMELADVVVAMHPGDNDDMVITVDGENAGVLIGHHGDTLDALQYLANLAANRKEEGEKREFARITVDVEDYRAKREEALRILARKKGNQVLKYKKSIMLEPMNPYERRIIHSEIQHMEGISTNSIGAENNRRVVIYLEEEGMPTAALKSEDARGEEGAAKSGSSRRRRRKPKSDKVVDPLAPATKREMQPSVFSDDDEHDPFDIDLSAALPSEDEETEKDEVVVDVESIETDAAIETANEE